MVDTAATLPPKLSVSSWGTYSRLSSIALHILGGAIDVVEDSETTEGIHMTQPDEARQKKTAAKVVCQMLGHDLEDNRGNPFSWVSRCLRCRGLFHTNTGKEVEFST